MAEKKNIAISLIETNKGQIEGVPANPRTIKDKKFKKLVASIEQNPEMLDLRELLVYPHGDKYVIIGGNMRYEACKKLGYKELPCKVIPAETDASTLCAYVVKDNGGYGEWDFDALANEWDEDLLDVAGIDLPDIKISSEEAEEDDFDESAPVETRCKDGDIWQLGEHRLMCGDSTNSESVTKLMGGAIADMLLTDPPYNVSYSKKNEFLNKYVGGERIQVDIHNDEMSSENFKNFLTKAFKCAFDVLKNGGSFYIWHSTREQLNFEIALNANGLRVRQQLIWNKTNMVLGMKDYQYKHEPCLYGWKEGASHYFINDRTKTTVIDCKRPSRNGEHPTMKPIELMGECINNSSREGELVLDLFGGSGSTLIACEQLNRKCYTMELDPHYCDVILARWEKFTGKTAERL